MKSTLQKNNFTLILFLCFTFFSKLIFAQEKPIEPLSNDSLTKEVHSVKKDLEILKKLKITGWVQAQMQFADSNGIANYDGGQFAANSDKRFMIRRGRIKFTYTDKNAQIVLQLNGTERGINVTEIFGVYTLPFFKWISISAGIMNRPFGYDIGYSSADRESPERARFTQTLMPNERDLGAKIIFAPTKESKLFGLRFDGGFYNGEGIYVPGTTTPTGYPAGTTPVLGVNEFDFGKDFIGRLSYYKTLKNDKIKFGVGASHYRGGNIYQNNVVYNQITTNSAGIKDWKAADTNSTSYKGKIAPRIYYGAEFLFSIKSIIGTTTLRGEYITGTQTGYAGGATGSQSPFFLPPANTPVYARNFNGFYGYLIHRIAKTKHEVALKYEWYDPNTKVSGKDMLGTTKNTFSGADVKFVQLGVTYIYYFDEHVKLMVNYNMVTNETTGDGKTAIKGFQKDIKDNILTIRLQYRF
jgi:hypothetical protein